MAYVRTVKTASGGDLEVAGHPVDHYLGRKELDCLPPGGADRVLEPTWVAEIEHIGRRIPQPR